MRVGSLCSGVGGLEMALDLADIDTELVFVADVDDGPNEVLTARFPGVPNLGDWTAAGALPDCDLLIGGLPCQTVSQAGQRLGPEDERWLFDDLIPLLGDMEPERRPDLFLENVLGLLTHRGGESVARVLHAFASLGYVGRYGTLAAADVGAPHRRTRWFAYVRNPNRVAGAEAVSLGLDESRGVRRWDRFGTGPRHSEVTSDPGSIVAERRRGPTGMVGTAPRTRVEGRRSDEGRNAAGDRSQTVANPDSDGPRRLETGDGPDRRVDIEPGHDVDGRSMDDFGPWTPAVRRWEHLLGRTAPAAVTDAGQLNPVFVEWMMGYPQGWVTDILDRRPALKALGNAVQPQQAAEAFRQLAS